MPWVYDYRRGRYWRESRGPDRRPRDVQRKRLYRWEDYDVAKKYADPLKNTMTIDEATDLIDKIFTEHDIPTPKVMWDRKTKTRAGAYYRCHPDTYQPAIVFSPTSLPLRYIVIHEAAHGVKYKYDNQEAAHGPMFVRVYIDLLEQYGNVDMSYLISTATGFGIKYAARPDYPFLNKPTIKKETIKFSTGSTLTWSMPA